MAFPFLMTNCADLPIEHLQLERSVTNALHRRGVLNLRELVELVGSERYPTSECVTGLDALEALAKVADAKDTDWYQYWKSRDFIFNYTLLTCPEFEPLNCDTPICPVDHDLFGNAAPMLSRAGYNTLGALAEGLRHGIPNISGMGAKKYGEFFSCLMKLIKGLRSGKLTLELLERNMEPTETPELQKNCAIAARQNDLYGLTDEVKLLGLGVLHAGTKSRMLEAAGLKTVGDVASLMPQGLLEISGMGKGTVERLDLALRQLKAAQDSNGGIDLQIYCAGLEVPLLPVGRSPMNGAEFVKMIGETLGVIGATLDDPVLQKIVAMRLSKLPQDRATLDEIGQSMSPPLTRERIRQREAKLLAALASALVYDDYANLNVHFRPEFANYWKLAALRFEADGESISFAALVDGLTDIWNVDRALLLEHLPLIATILTGEVATGTALGDTAVLDQRLFSLSDEVSAVPLRRFQIGRAARTLAEHGIDELGKLIAAINAGQVSKQSGAHFRLAIEHLQVVADALDANGQINWDNYNQYMGIESVPVIAPLSPLEFLNDLQSSISKILTITPPTMRSKEIFESRIIHHLGTRATTEALGEKLGTYASSIKREETVTLEFLNDVIIQRNYASACLDLRAEFLDLWSAVSEDFDKTDGDANDFCQLLSLRWKVGQKEIDAALPILIAVLTGYPFGRLSRHTKLRVVEKTVIEPLPDMQSEVALPTTLILRGFRRSH